MENSKAHSRPQARPMLALDPLSTMQEVLVAFPGARRALFRKYHLGGCSSCGFAPTETLAQLCARNGNLNVDEVIANIQAAAETDHQLEISPEEVVERRAQGGIIRLLDLRTREEWNAVHLEGAEFVSQELIQRLMGREGQEGLLVFYDHVGTSSIDAAAYFAGHGFVNARFLRGGIDAWSVEVDSKVPRYKLESA
jgi:rhodanese-related sulfurtransferase